MSAEAHAHSPAIADDLTQTKQAKHASNPHHNMWDDDTIELSDVRARSEIPKLPTVDRELQVIKGKGAELLAFLMLQILKSKDKEVIVRAIASAAAILLGTSMNLTAAPNPATILTGLDIARDENANDETLLETNFVDAEPVTVGELLTTMEIDTDEIGSYFGVLFVAGNKRVTNQNRTAFNDRRRAAATASVIGEAKIFIPDSEYLSDMVLHKVYAAFLSYSPARANLTSRVVQLLSNNLMGPSLAFANMFLLLADFGMNALKIIKEATIKHPWVLSDFPELKPELTAANHAQQVLRRVPGIERSFLKAIHGNAFVPVSYNQIDNLVGVCKEILKRSTPSYENYGGGRITASQEVKINNRMGVPETAISTVRSE